MNAPHLFLAAASISITALAAAPSAQAQETPWAGFYVGAHLGGVWGDTSTATQSRAGQGGGIPPSDIALINGARGDTSNKSGLNLGIEGGYNYVIGPLLIGLEMDWGAMDVSQTAVTTARSTRPGASPDTYRIDERLSTDWIWTLRPRIGYVADRWMVYATGGLATTQINYRMEYADNASPARSAAATLDDSKSGYALGLGGAFAITPTISLKGEWLYADFGRIRGSAATADGYAAFTSDASVNANLLRVGVDYHF